MKRRVGHVHAPPVTPTAEGAHGAKKKRDPHGDEARHDERARARPRIPLDRHRPSLASRGTRVTAVREREALGTHPRSLRFRTGGKEGEGEMTLSRSFLRTHVGSRDW